MLDVLKEVDVMKMGPGGDTRAEPDYEGFYIKVWIRGKSFDISLEYYNTTEPAF